MGKEKQLVLKMVDEGLLQPQLFKYRSLSNSSKEYTLDIFRKCELYFAAPAEFNDPFDCKFYPVISSRERFARVIAERQTLDSQLGDVENAIMNDENIEARIRNAVDTVMNRHGICSFSRNNAGILMWSHYADCHRGVCLEFDVLEDPNFFVNPKDVTYQSCYPLIDMARSDGSSAYVEALLGTKFSEWSYEDEVRVYNHQSKKAFPFNPKALKSVIFGCKANDEVIEEVKNIVRENPALSHVEFYRAVMDDKEYKLNIVKIDD